MKALTWMLLVAAAGFFALFSPWTGAVPFWPVMTAMAAGLSAGALWLDRGQLKPIYTCKLCDLPAGLAGAMLLYGLFWLGHWVSTRILPFAAGQIDAIYAIKAGQNRWVLAVLLLAVIGPGEEIFWRGFVQRRLSKQYGGWVGFVVATAIYTLVHLWSFNPMLLAASAVCGAFWGGLFAVTGRVWPGLVSHAVWDVAIFIWMPLNP